MFRLLLQQCKDQGYRRVREQLRNAVSSSPVRTVGLLHTRLRLLSRTCDDDEGVHVCVTAVEAEWLAKLGPMFFSIKESYQTRMEKKKKEKKTRENGNRDANRRKPKRQNGVGEVETRKDQRRGQSNITPGLGGSVKRSALS